MSVGGAVGWQYFHVCPANHHRGGVGHGVIKSQKHLIGTGKRRIAHLAGPDALLISRKRLQGYRDALAVTRILPTELVVRGSSTPQQY